MGAAKDVMMPSTAKDSLFEAAASEGTAKTEIQASQSSDAIGAEVPVTIHASRYSAASKGAGKLPPVHEETRTVIIFPQGAVVRLSAMVTPGELVVVTNNRTGADVICRVTSVKTQPGIQNYVNLEFTQRALGFWEEPRQPERPVVKDKAALGVVSPAAPAQAPTPITAVPKVTVPAVQPETTARSSAPSAEAKSISTQPLRVTSLADTSATRSREAVQQIPTVEPQVPEVAPAPAASTKQPRAISARGPRLETFDSPSFGEDKDQENKGSNKRIVLILTAAIVLLAIGAVGGALFLRWNRAIAITQQQPSTAPVSTAASEPVATMPTPGLASAEATPITNASVKSNSLAPASSISTLPSNPGPGTPALAQSTPARLSIETPKIEVHSEPQPEPVSRPNINIGKISAPNVKTTAKMNAVEPPPVLTADLAAMPKGINDNVVNTVAPGSSIASPGAPPVAVQGGQLVQPKLISSIASAYPAAAKSAHVQGDVLIDAMINGTGKVVATKVINGPPLLQEAAVNSLRLWKYEPGRLNGQPIPMHIKVNINFRLE